MDLAFEDADLVAEGENLDLECGFLLSAEDKEIEQRANDGVKQAQDHGRGSWRLGRGECWRCRCRGDHRGQSTFLNSTRIQVGSLFVGAVDRTSRVYRPPRLAPWPGLMIVLHGEYGSGLRMARQLGEGCDSQSTEEQA